MNSLMKLFFFASIATATAIMTDDTCARGMGFCAARIFDFNTVMSSVRQHLNISHMFCEKLVKLGKCIQNPIFGCLEDASSKKSLSNLKSHMQAACDPANLPKLESTIYACMPVYIRCVFQLRPIFQQLESKPKFCRMISIKNCLKEANVPECSDTVSALPCPGLLKLLGKYCLLNSTEVPTFPEMKPLLEPRIVFSNATTN